jgi:drug/metabolite transporter (DMT)-like permease
MSFNPLGCPHIPKLIFRDGKREILWSIIVRRLGYILDGLICWLSCVDCFESVDLKERKDALFLTILAGVLWGTSFPAIKIGLVFLDPYMFVFLRMFLASVLVLLISSVTKNLNLSLAKERLVWYLGVLNGCAYLIQYVGMSFTTASKSSLFVNLSAVWVAVLSWLVLKEHFSKKKVLGIISGLIGVFFITTNLDVLELAHGMIIGDGLVLLSGILWSFFTVYNKKVVDSHNAFQSIPWIFLATTLPLTPFILLSNTSSLLNLPAEAWIVIVYTAVFCWLIPYYLWLKGLKHISPATSTIILLTEVIVAIIISFSFLEEIFTVISGVGASLILLAIVLVSIS